MRTRQAIRQEIRSNQKALKIINKQLLNLKREDALLCTRSQWYQDGRVFKKVPNGYDSEVVKKDGKWVGDYKG